MERPAIARCGSPAQGQLAVFERPIHAGGECRVISPWRFDASAETFSRVPFAKGDCEMGMYEIAEGKGIAKKLHALVRIGRLSQPGFRGEVEGGAPEEASPPQRERGDPTPFLVGHRGDTGKVGGAPIAQVGLRPELFGQFSESLDCAGCPRQAE